MRLDRADSGWTFAESDVSLYVPSNESDATVEAVTVYAPAHKLGEIVMVPGGAAEPPVFSHDARPGHGIDLVALGESRADVRRRLHDAMTHIDPPDSKEPVEDLFWDDGLVVEYDDRDRVCRIVVVKADEVRYAGINLMPDYPVSLDAVRQLLLSQGHPVTNLELGLELDGTGIQLWQSNTQTGLPLPVSAVVISR